MSMIGGKSIEKEERRQEERWLMEALETRKNDRLKKKRKAEERWAMRRLERSLEDMNRKLDTHDQEDVEMIEMERAVDIMIEEDWLEQVRPMVVVEYINNSSGAIMAMEEDCLEMENMMEDETMRTGFWMNSRRCKWKN